MVLLFDFPFLASGLGSPLVRALYATADKIGESSGGQLALHEIAALERIADEVVVLGWNELNPGRFHQPESPFAYDYWALQQIKDQHFDLAELYSGTFTQTVRWLRSQGTKVSYCVPAHDRHVTVDEFQRLGLDYPFRHIKDDDLWAIFSQGYREADLVIAQSQYSVDVLRREGCRQRIEVVSAGCDIPQTVAPHPERFTVGYLGQVGPDKGLIYLLQAWSKLNWDDAVLLLAGSGTETLGPFIQRTVPNGRFQLMGRVPSPSDLYNKCSVYVQPSVTESFALEVPEAMAHQRPVIVTEGVGAKDLVRDGITGFVVPIRDPDALAEKLVYFKEKPEQIRRMGALAWEKSLEVSWAKVEQHYKEVFQSLL